MTRNAILVAVLVAAAGLPMDLAQARLRRSAQPQPPAETLPAPTAAGCAACCPPVNICYRDKTCRSVCCDPCAPKIKTTLLVCDPCTGCPIPVDVCLPGCCTDTPCVTERCTLFARGAVTYEWDCGFSATIRFRRSGDVLVTYRS